MQLSQDIIKRKRNWTSVYESWLEDGTVVHTQCSFEPPGQTVIIAPDVDTLKLSLGDQNHQVHRQFGIQD